MFAFFPPFLCFMCTFELFFSTKISILSKWATCFTFPPKCCIFHRDRNCFCPGYVDFSGIKPWFPKIFDLFRIDLIDLCLSKQRWAVYFTTSTSSVLVTKLTTPRHFYLRESHNVNMTLHSVLNHCSHLRFWQWSECRSLPWYWPETCFTDSTWCKVNESEE